MSLLEVIERTSLASGYRKLQKENTKLKAELAACRDGALPPDSRTRPPCPQEEKKAPATSKEEEIGRHGRPAAVGSMSAFLNYTHTNRP